VGVCSENPSAIESLESTTFSGRRFTRNQLVKVVDTIRMFPNLSRTELAFTLCEHLSWKSPNGSLKVNSAVEFLEKLESLGLVALPAGRGLGKKGPDKVILTARSEEKAPIGGSLDGISPIELHLVDTPAERGLWNEFMARYHYLGYKRPFGAYLRYFVVAKGGEKIGCLLFASSAWALACRDEWIGWKNWHRAKHLHLIVSNSRFLIFPWVRVPNLASHILSLIPGRIGSDWPRKYNYKPVLIETFVDQEKYAGTCYKAANWQHLGQTKGQGQFYKANQSVGSIKDVYAYPLEVSFRDTLIHGRKSRSKNETVEITNYSNGKFIEFWDKVVHIVNEVATEFDGKWQIRKRVIDSMLLIMLIFRLVSSKARQGYGSTIDDLWENCRKIRQPLPKRDSIAPSSFTVARRKLDESAFKTINTKIVTAYGTELGESFRWQGHRIFAVDGTKMNLPRKLISAGYRVPSNTAHYPQGLVSCLYHLHARVPWDFDLADHEDERKCALSHLKALKKDDIVVYDRGYFSYVLLSHHAKTGIHAIFRLSDSTCKPIVDFIQSDQTDAIVTIFPNEKSQRRISESYPNIGFEPQKLRLIKYTISETTYYLGTTLLDPRYDADIFPDAYHARWGIEELYKVSKQILAVDDFHAKTLRGIKQELYAHFVLITMNRIFANHTDDPNSRKGLDAPIEPPLDATTTIPRVNFKNCISAFVRNIEALFLQKAETLKQTLVSLIARVSHRRQKTRPNRNYPRISMKPTGKRRLKKSQQLTAVAA
jgi:Domain of unknown function (DUF4338)/Transposase DDE domain